MSKEFLTRSEAALKLGKVISGKDFITALEATGLGANPIPLSSYPAGDFPVDDDIISDKIPVNLVFSLYTDGILQNVQSGTPVLYAVIYSSTEISLS